MRHMVPSRSHGRPGDGGEDEPGILGWRRIVTWEEVALAPPSAAPGGAFIRRTEEASKGLVDMQEASSHTLPVHCERDAGC